MVRVVSGSTTGLGESFGVDLRGGGGVGLWAGLGMWMESGVGGSVRS